MVMQSPHIRNLDLSLVEPLFALLDERNVTGAAHRCDMSQSAMTRALAV
jgi:DNA-binding transcriptional LysR family regulator